MTTKLVKPLVRGLAGLALCGALSSLAAVTPAPLFAPHMVLQRDLPLPVWGTADAGEQVTVTLADRSAVTVAGADGAWRVTLPALPAGGPHVLTIAAGNTVSIDDVLIGEVWICSGQSNMNWRVANSNNRDQEVASANYPKLRHFQIANRVSPQPLSAFAGTWTVCSPETVANWTAVGYFFGRELATALDVPIGLIHTSWGGTPAEAWTSRPKLESLPECKPILDRFAEAVARWPEAKARFDEVTIPNWQKQVEAAKAEGKPAPRRPQPPLNEEHPHSPAGLYNAMINPLIPYAIRGAIWYQGESNAGRAVQYRALFPAMIQDWRQAWGQGDFPFYFVQLANFKQPQTDPNNTSDWAELREAQTMTLSLPNTGMACTIDIGEANDIHPRNKQDVGRRLALCSLAKDFGKDVVYSGPMFSGMSKAGNTIRIDFAHAGNGLNVQGEKLNGFVIAGADQRFVWADARIDGKSVVVSSPEVPEPVAVRYGWADNPPCNLFNAEGLPAVPFRTDTWPEVTRDKL